MEGRRVKGTGRCDDLVMMTIIFMSPIKTFRAKFNDKHYPSRVSTQLPAYSTSLLPLGHLAHYSIRCSRNMINEAVLQ